MEHAESRRELKGKSAKARLRGLALPVSRLFSFALGDPPAAHPLGLLIWQGRW